MGGENYETRYQNSICCLRTGDSVRVHRLLARQLELLCTELADLLTRRELDPELIDQYLSLVQTCDYQRFAPADVSREGQVKRAARGLIQSALMLWGQSASERESNSSAPHLGEIQTERHHVRSRLPITSVG